MAIPILAIQHEGEVFSPFTGRIASTEEGELGDESVLFTYWGDAGLFGGLSDRLLEAVSAAGLEDLEDMEPLDVLQAIDIPGAFAVEVDAGWNGVNCFAFAPLP